jgi:hypothetical protein
VDKRRKLMAHVGTISAPVLALAGARVFLAPPPAAMSDSTVTQVAIVSAPPSKVTLSAAQQRAIDWAGTLRTEGLKSPLCRRIERPSQPLAATPPEQPDTHAPDPEPAPREDPTLGLRLTAIMGTVESGMAMVNGKVYRVDDEVKPGLRVVFIDARNNRIILEDAMGEQHTLGRVEQE